MKKGLVIGIIIVIILIAVSAFFIFNNTSTTLNCGTIKTENDFEITKCFIEKVIKCEPAIIQISPSTKFELLKTCNVRITNLIEQDLGEDCLFKKGAYRDCESDEEVLEMLKDYSEGTFPDESLMYILAGIQGSGECEGELWKSELKCFSPDLYMELYGEGISECQEMADEEKNICIRKYAEIAKDPDLCSESPTPDFCYNGYAQSFQRQSRMHLEVREALLPICNKINDTSLRAQCKYRYSIVKEISVCDSLNDLGEKDFYEDCIIAYATEENNASICEEKSSESKKPLCLNTVQMLNA